MKLIHLRYLHAVVKNGGYRKAAAAIHVSQPVITSAIQKLEAELGVPLLQRTSKGLVLTEAGEIVYHRTQNILSEIDGIYTELEEINHQQNQTIHLAFYLCENLPAKLVSSFLPLHPDCQIFIEQCGPRKIIQGLNASEYNIGITLEELVPPDFCSIHYDTVELGAFFMKGHPFEALTDISIPNLEKERLLIPDGLAPVIQKYFSQESASGQKVESISGMDFYVASVMAASGEGIAVCPMTQASGKGNISVRGFSPPLIRDLAITWPKHIFLSQTMQALIQFLQDN